MWILSLVSLLKVTAKTWICEFSSFNSIINVFVLFYCFWKEHFIWFQTLKFNQSHYFLPNMWSSRISQVNLRRMFVLLFDCQQFDHNVSCCEPLCLSYMEFTKLLKCMFVIVQLLSLVWLLCNPMDCGLPGSSDYGISQARILEWVAISFSRGSSRHRNQTYFSCIGRQILYHWATR